MFTLIRGQQQQ